MNRIECPGLDGANPLHFLASLGVLRVLSLGHPLTKMLWRRKESTWCPSYENAAYCDLNMIAQELNRWLCVLGRVSVVSPDEQKHVRALSAEVKKLDGELKDGMKAKRSEWKMTRPNLRGRELDVELRQFFKEKELRLSDLRQNLADAQIKVGDSLGNGVAHLGDIIGISSPLFRYKAEVAASAFVSGKGMQSPSTDNPVLIAAMFPALGCDIVGEDGKVTPTPYSFANGSSGQCLLKTFREAADRVTFESTLGCLSGAPVYSREISSLGWDPADQGSYALQWKSPKVSNKKGNKDVDPSIQVLGYLGLSYLPSMPVEDGLAATGFRSGREKGFQWPIWDSPLNGDVVAGLLGSDRNWGMPGIVDRRMSMIQNPNGKRNFFAPSRSM